MHPGSLLIDLPCVVQVNYEDTKQLGFGAKIDLEVRATWPSRVNMAGTPIEGCRLFAIELLLFDD